MLTFTQVPLRGPAFRRLALRPVGSNIHGFSSISRSHGCLALLPLAGMAFRVSPWRMNP